MNEIGKRLKMLREANCFTLQEVADMLNMHRSAINKYEMGHVENMKRSTILKLAQIYGVSPSYLFDFTDEQRPITDDFDKLDEEDQKAVRRMIEGLLQSEKYKKTKTDTIA